LLAADCVIHGYLPELRPSGAWHGVLACLAGARQPETLELASAQVFSLHGVPAPGAALPVTTGAARLHVARASILAILPADDLSARLAHPTLARFAHPVSSVLYAGPYLLRGRLWQPARAVRATPRLMLLTDAEIECLRPGAELAATRSPIVAVRRAAIQAYHVG
jgi:hypothetical protein